MDATWDTPFSRIAKDIYARQFNSAFHAVKAEGIAAPSTPASQTNDMSTFKYGTSCDPLRRTSIRDLNPHWEEGSGKKLTFFYLSNEANKSNRLSFFGTMAMQHLNYLNICLKL